MTTIKPYTLYMKIICCCGCRQILTIYTKYKRTKLSFDGNFRGYTK